MKPSQIGGHEYRTKAMTSLGEMRRILRAFDRDDAMEQLLNYCFGEGLAVDIETVEIVPILPARTARRPEGGEIDRLAS